MSEPPLCLCSAQLPDRAGRGRHGIYCSDRCRKRAQHQREASSPTHLEHPQKPKQLSDSEINKDEYAVGQGELERVRTHSREEGDRRSGDTHTSTTGEKPTRQTIA